MARIFISYRRADSADITGRIDDRLAIHFGRKNIFRDTESIAVGDDFIEVLRHEVAASDVMLVIIGKEWASIKSSDGTKHLEIDGDFVRIEVETALRLPSVRVIPVLVNGAKMPSTDELPSTLATLTHRNGVEFRNEPDFGKDMFELIKKIESTTNNAKPSRNLFQRLPRFIYTFILFITAIASSIFTFISILPESQRHSILEVIGVVPFLTVTNTPQATDSQTPDIHVEVTVIALQATLDYWGTLAPTVVASPENRDRLGNAQVYPFYDDTVNFRDIMVVELELILYELAITPTPFGEVTLVPANIDVERPEVRQDLSNLAIPR